MSASVANWRSAILPRADLACALAFVAILLVAWIAYHPGLGGQFLFDDFANLPALGDTGPVQGWHALLRYVTSGQADPTGRPLTLLTFLIDANDWPADPYSFKYTNVLLHLLNGVLLLWAMLALGRRAELDEGRARWAALFGAAFWLLHPLFVSTTLYVVQREAMLPATFALIGMICWCKGRERLDQGRPRAAIAWMTTGAWLCTALAVLCKGNGILLPLLIAVAEWTVLLRRSAPPDDGDRTLRRARWILLGLPIALLVAYLVFGIPADIRSAAEYRSWSLGQRLLSEPRVLADYLRLLWLPRATSYGVFNDQVRASTDWLHPWTTLPCIVLVVALIGSAIAMRRRLRLLAFAVLFFFAGHLLESSFLPLELAFEHRNYLPAAFMFWPVAVWLTATPGRQWKGALGAAVIAMLALLTWTRCGVWGDLRQQALVWARINPDSARAQAFAAAIEMNYGNDAAAISRLRKVADRMPDEVQITLNLVDAECKAGAVDARDWERALYSLRTTTNGSRQVFNWFTGMVPVAQARRCAGITLADLQDALSAARANPKFGHQSGRRQDYEHVAGLIAIARGKPDEALEDFNEALLDAPDRGTALAQAAALGSAGYPAWGLSHLDFAATHSDYIKMARGMPQIHDWLLRREGYWRHETERLRATLAQDAESRRQQPRSGE